MPPSDQPITVVGETNFRGKRRRFGVYTDDRRRHVYAIGKTGSGKTTLMENMIVQDIASGHGVGVVDPHGDMVERLLDSVPPWRINDVVYFDPSDVDYPIGFNVLEASDPAYKYLVASGLVSSLKKIWADSWGPRLEYILRNTILALLDYPGSTMLGIMRMLSDKVYRKKVVDYIQDPVIKAFWTNEFANYNDKFRSEAVSPIQNKVGQFLSSAIIRNIVAQPKSTIDMKDIMDNGKILLMNVSKGKIGEDNSALLGAMLITKIQLAAMDRAKLPEEDRRDFFLFVDEFQNFATESFATILSEARKYRLNLTIAHQYITQMEEPVRDAVFGNVGTIVCFRIGAFDAEYLEKEFAPTFMEKDLVNLNKYNAYIKLMINGVASKPFSMQTIPPAAEQFDKREVVLKVSRERYGQPREVVEEKIARWSGVTFQGAAEQDNKINEQERPSYRRDDRAFQKQQLRWQSQPDEPRQERPQREERTLASTDASLADVVLKPAQQEITDLASALRQDAPRVEREPSRPARELFTVTCSRCGKETQVPFKPMPGRDVFCKECLAIVREERARGAVAEEPAKPAAAPPASRPAAKPPILTARPAEFSGPPAPPVRR